MPRPKPKPTENKLLMLYAIERIGPVTSDQALRFFVGNDFMDYIDVALSLAELVDGGLLVTGSEPLGKTHSLTRLGGQTISFFSDEIPASRREAVDGIAEHWHRVFTKEANVFADYDSGIADDIIVRLAARESGALLIEVRVSVPGKKQAEDICSRWQERSDDIYAKIMQLLMQDQEVKGDA